MKKNILFAALMMLTTALAAQTQTKDTSKTEFIYDTVKTHVIYITDSKGNIGGTWAKRVQKSQMQFTNPTPDELKQETVTLKKQKVLVDFWYLIDEKVETVVNKKTVAATETHRYTKQWIVSDSQRSYDDLIKSIFEETKKN